MNRYPKNRHFNPTPGSTGGSGSAPTFRREGFITDGVDNAYTVSNPIAQIIAVFFNQTYVDPGSYTVVGQDLDFTDPPAVSPDGTANLWVIYI